MSRKNIFDILADNYDIVTELQRIAKLFNKHVSYYDGETYITTITIEQMVDKYMFHDWKSRKTCVSCEDMRYTLRLADDPEEICNMNEDMRYTLGFEEIGNMDEVITYLEYYANICNLASQADYIRENKNFKMLEDNIDMLIDKLSHEQIYIESEQKILIIPKNPEGIAAAEISSEKTGIAILRYHHHLLKGDLDKKSKILFEIAKPYEEMLKSKPCEPKDIFSKTWSLLNRLNIRHDNEENEKNIAKLNSDGELDRLNIRHDNEENEKNIAKLNSDGELESWYDEIYQMLLLCILLSDNISRMERVDELEERLKKDNK
jgi:hypothetical protein